MNINIKRYIHKKWGNFQPQFSLKYLWHGSNRLESTTRSVKEYWYRLRSIAFTQLLHDIRVK